MVVVLGGLGQLPGTILAALADRRRQHRLRVRQHREHRQGAGLRAGHRLPAVAAVRRSWRSAAGRLDGHCCCSLWNRPLEARRDRIRPRAALLVGASRSSCCAGPVFLSDFRLTLLAKFLSVRDRGARPRSALGLRRHVEPRPWRLLRSRRVCGGDVPEARGGRQRACPTSWPGAAHELPWFWVPFSIALFAFTMAIVAPLLLAALLGFLSFRSRYPGGLLLDHDAGAGADREHPADRPAAVHRRHQRHDQLLHCPGLSADRAGRAGRTLLRGPGRLAAAYLLCRTVTQSRFGLLLVAMRDDPRGCAPAATTRSTIG